ncbi:hypothetical protein Holit_00705 [Hollandina sp. SP2]
MQVSPRMYSSDGSLEGMNGMDKGGEPSSFSSKQGQGKSRKQDKFDFFARLLEGLVKNSPKLNVLGDGQPAEEAPAGNEGKGNAGKKNPQKQVRLSSGEAQEGERSRSRKGVQDLSQNSRNNRDSGGSFSFLAVQEGQGSNQAGLQVLHQKKDSPPLPRRHMGKVHLAAAPGSQTETGSGDLGGKTEAAVQEAGSQGNISKLKANNRNIQDHTGAEKAGSSKTGIFRTIQAIGTDERLTRSLDTPQGMEAGEESARKGLKKDADGKVRDKRRDRMDLRELRSREGAEPVSGSLVLGNTKSVAETNTLELTVELHTDTPDQEALPGPRETSLSGSFEDILARELSQNLNGDIVRQAQVLLRDCGEGTIRLALRPESLGNVKIQLELAEKKIIGHIIVESNEALRAFEREIHSLEQAFKDSGFGETRLDTALASDGRGGNPHQRDPESGPFFSERFALSTYDTTSERNEEGERGLSTAGNRGLSGHSPIDMLV